MAFLETVYNGISAFTDWLWGLPILFLLIGGGLVLTVLIGGVQFTRFGFIFKNTLGTVFNKDLQEEKKKGGVTPYQGMIAALSATVGTGNIVGVGAAIALGGPGALFWMWVCGFVAMAIKYAEVTMACAYREKQADGSYKAGPYMYIRDGLHCKPVAILFGIAMIVTLSFISSVHASALTSNLGGIGVNKYIACGIIVLFIVLVIFGGMKALVKITEKMVPIMAGIYLVFALIVIVANIGNIGSVLVSIFKGAFTGTAALGGFTGATLAATVRWGLARGVFSNDAGLGLSASVQGQVASIDHPAQQGMWAIIETFLDTIVICTLTGLLILFSGVWSIDGESATYAARAMETVFGSIGHFGCVLSLVLFGLSSLITNTEGCGIQAESMFNSKLVGRLFQIFLLAVVVLGCLTDISKAFMLADFGNGICLLLNVPALILLGKGLRSLSREWFGNNGDLAAISRARNSK